MRSVPRVMIFISFSGSIPKYLIIIRAATSAVAPKELTPKVLPLSSSLT